MINSILLVDDQPLIRMDIREILELNGYEVVGEAGDGFEAVSMCKELNPDLVLMDIDMPMLDGLKAGKIITKENTAGGIILLTSFSDKETIEKAKKIGAFGYLVKPVNEKSLITTIEMCLTKVKEFEKMKKDLEKANSKLHERKIVERAKRILIKEFKISEDEAYTRIRKLSMDKRNSILEISKMIIIGYDE